MTAVVSSWVWLASAAMARKGCRSSETQTHRVDVESVKGLPELGGQVKDRSGSQLPTMPSPWVSVRPPAAFGGQGHFHFIRLVGVVGACRCPGDFITGIVEMDQPVVAPRVGVEVHNTSGKASGRSVASTVKALLWESSSSVSKIKSRRPSRMCRTTPAPRPVS